MIFVFVILILSAVIHEVFHGQVALMLGDKTAKHMGRITLNPIKHADFLGTLIVPILSIISHGFLLAWAKPVPVNPANLQNPKRDMALVSVAGPISNIIIASILAGIVHLLTLVGLFDRASITQFQFGSFASPSDFLLSAIIVNLQLALFNLIPIPPLDGSKILFGLLPRSMHYVEDFLNQYWPVFLFVFIFFLSWILLPLVFGTFKLLLGL